MRSGEEALRRRRLRQPVGARTATARIGFLEIHEADPGDRCQHRTHLRTDTLAVRDVPRVGHRDGTVERVRRRRP